MSEYQYYEFQAIDRPLTEREIRELRSCSTRATITPTRFVNFYDWGGLKGDPSEWMEKYFDAFLYLANWGTRELILRLPRRVLDLGTARRYCCGESASARAKGDFVILEFHSEDEGGDWEGAGEGWLSSLIPLRGDIAGGDHRALYLAWLLCAQTGELEDEATEPPRPPGLWKLTGPLMAFADFLRIDTDLMAVVAELSRSAAETAPLPALRRRIAALPESEKTDLLARFAQGEGSRLRAELLLRFREVGDGATRSAGPRPLTIAKFLAASKRHAEERRRGEAERAAKVRARQERREAAARARYLKGLAKRQPKTWRRVNALVLMRRPSDYDEAVRLLKDLRDLGYRQGKASKFETRVRKLGERHANKPSFLERLRKANLLEATR